MRIASTILGILGGLVAAALGAKWWFDAHALRALIDFARASGMNTSEIDRLLMASYLLMGAFVVSIVGAVLTARGKGKIGGSAMLAAAVAPMFLVPMSAVFTSVLALAGVLGLFSKPKQIAQSQNAPMYAAAA